MVIQNQDGQTINFEFQKPFRIGRDESCEIQIQRPGISRHHAEVYFQDGYWWFKDLNSANGSYFMGNRIQEIPLGKTTKVELGFKDAVLNFSVPEFSPEGKTVVEKPPSLTQYIQHYFEKKPEKRMGDHTRMIHNAFQKMQKKQKSRFLMIIAGILLIAALIAIYSYTQHQQIKKQKLLAQQIFYTMKTLELEIARLQEWAEQQQDSATLTEIKKQRSRQEELSKNYQNFLDELHFYDTSQWSEVERIILRVARSFGECELTMPKEFMEEVKRYIQEWKKTDRLKNAIQRAVQNGYPSYIAKVMAEYNLPPQFFYVGLQESNFDVRTVGPRTRFGIAKGIWQFIPATAERYGLHTGPLVGVRKFDPKDQRMDFQKSTRAAARYLRDIYNTEAQASGLLVIASYNWGERRIRELVRQMPKNPRERNFWQLLTRYRDQIPRQTYDYVFYIFSAAVIGENPRLFGFDFDSPLRLSAEDTIG
ncbi:MAG: hypothetical protein Kow0042_21400 [Calditrichia bacterium]